MGRWWACLLWMVTLAAQAATAQPDYYYRSWQSDEGLPDNTVVGLAQSADGFLWVASQSGLARFDGVRFREFPSLNAAGEPSTPLHSLFLDRQDRLWIAKDHGVLICLEQGRISRFIPENRLPDLTTHLMVEDRQGGLWVSYLNEGVTRIFDGKARSYTSSEGLPDGGTCQLTCDKGGQIWFAKAGQIGVFRHGKFNKLLNIPAQRIAAARSGGIWIYALAQLFHFSEANGLVKAGDLPVSRRTVNATVLYEDSLGAIWIGTQESGLFRHDSSGFRSIQTSHHDILSITGDREGNVWVGTGGGGLNRGGRRTVELLDVASGLSAEAVRSVCQDTTGDLWATTQSGSVTRNSGSGWIDLSTNANWPIQYAQCITADPKGGVWIGTQYLGLFHWDRRGISNLGRPPTPSPDAIRTLLATQNGDLWIGTESANSLQRMRAGKFRPFPLPAGSGIITAMVVDAAGRVWVGTAGGFLLQAVEDSLVDQTHRTLAQPESIHCLCATPEGNLWIGYAGRGVGRLGREGFFQFGAEEGLHDNYVSQIVADRQGELWFAGNQGVFHVPTLEFDALAQGKAGRIRSIVLGRNEGLPSLKASHGFWPGALLDRGGTLYIPTLTGLAAITPNDNPKPPPILITRVAVDGRTVATIDAGGPLIEAGAMPGLNPGQMNSTIRIAPDHERVDLEFTAPSFTSPRNILFQYKLEGLDKRWLDAGTKREVYFPHLPAGDYVFRVAAFNEQGIRSETEAKIRLKILPFYWQTWGFRILATAGASLLFAGLVAWRVRLRQRRRIEQLERQRAMERERTRIAEDLHDELGAGLTEISFGSEFALDPLLEAEARRRHTREIGNRARELVTSLDEIVWAVNPKNDTVASLASYLCQFAERFLKPTRLRLRLRVDRNLPAVPLNAEERHNLFLAVKEALHNALQHARATEVELIIKTRPPLLIVVVADDGCGFDPSTARSEADGLGNMRRRLSQIAGVCTLSSSLGQGSTVTFELPLNNLPEAKMT